MKKMITLCSLFFVIVSCGQNHKALPREVAAITGGSALQSIDSLVAKISYPQSNQMEYKGELIADLASETPLVSSFGTVAKNTTLNYITIEGIHFLVYGEDGVFAAECEVSADYPDHGPTNPSCETIHAESFDKIILCTSTAKNVDLSIAQSWPGPKSAMETDSLGMECWINGQKMISNKIFTY
jgi:hypothetical protein